MSIFCAPSAIRIPISLVRCATRVSDYAVNSDRSQNHGDAGERAEQHHVKPRLRESKADAFLQWLERWNKQILVELVNNVAQRSLQSDRIARCRPNDNIHPARRIL